LKNKPCINFNNKVNKRVSLKLTDKSVGIFAGLAKKMVKTKNADFEKCD